MGGGERSAGIERPKRRKREPKGRRERGGGQARAETRRFVKNRGREEDVGSPIASQRRDPYEDPSRIAKRRSIDRYLENEARPKRGRGGGGRYRGSRIQEKGFEGSGWGRKGKRNHRRNAYAREVGIRVKNEFRAIGHAT